MLLPIEWLVGLTWTLWALLVGLEVYRFAIGKLLLTCLWLPVFDQTGWALRLVRVRAVGELLLVVALGLGLVGGTLNDAVSPVAY